MGLRAQPDQFELARQRAQQQANAAKQTQSDAIKRRFASQGMAQSGAAIKQEQLANEAVDKQLSEQNQQIDTAAQQEAARKQEIQDQRDFARVERLQSQEYAAAEQNKAREFAGAESQKARELQLDLFNQDLGFKNKSLEENRAQFNAQFGLAKAQYAQDREITGLNAIIAAQQSGIPWTGFKNDSPIEVGDIDGKINELATQKFGQIEAERRAAAAASTRRTKEAAFANRERNGR